MKCWEKVLLNRIYKDKHFGGNERRMGKTRSVSGKKKNIDIERWVKLEVSNKEKNKKRDR